MLQAWAISDVAAPRSHLKGCHCVLTGFRRIAGHGGSTRTVLHARGIDGKSFVDGWNMDEASDCIRHQYRKGLLAW